MEVLTQIRDQIAEVQGRIAKAAIRSGRRTEEVLLVAVTKTHHPETILMAAEAGLRHFGENRVEEALSKIPALRPKLADSTWHMIGHIQSRKCRDVAELFQWVHSVDRLKIAERLSQSGKELDILLEVNLSGEASKSGFALEDWPDNVAQSEAFYSEVEAISALERLKIRGLMTIAPMVDTPEQARPVFKRMRLLLDELKRKYPAVEWRHLSMGMSGDYEIAIEEGATIVRIGTALFGARL